jgi:SAM-dependent methyltransferase
MQRAVSECWLCGHSPLQKVKDNSINSDLTSTHFSITDSQYGMTLAIYCCQRCRFLQCGEIDDALVFYERMEDLNYEETRQTRIVQSRKLLEIVQAYKAYGRLLDVGAGSGVMVEAALKAGFQAEGLEPSAWLQSKATERGLRVLRGSLPCPYVSGPYDVVCMIDVIEHVTDPIGMLREVISLLDDDGIGFLVTPDVNSLAARIMGWKWWHYRIAHLGYFNLATLDLALTKAGASRIYTVRPSWFFPLSYLWTRLGSYSEILKRISLPSAIGNIVVPLNLYDSFAIVFKKVK